MERQTSLRETLARLGKSLYAWLDYQLDDQKSQGSIAVLDGVRAIACIVVVIYHSTGVVYWRWNIGHISFLAALNASGAKSVTLFFVLSGLLLFLPYARALLFGKTWPEARMFYMRRFLRIVPGYFFALFALLLLAKPAYLDPRNWKTIVFFLTFFMTRQQSDQLNGVYWTLAVEFQYYMLLPLIALGIYGLARLVRPARRLWVVIGSLFVMMAWGVATRYLGERVYGLPDANLLLTSQPIVRGLLFLVYGANGDQGKFFEDFACGMLIAVCYTVLSNTPRRDIYRRVLLQFSPWLWWIGILILIFAAWCNADALPYMPAIVTMTGVYPDWLVELTFVLGFSCCILAILYNGSGLLKRIFAWTPLRWIGLMSFSLYLWHEPIISSLEGNLAPALFRHFRGLLALATFALIELLLVLSVSFTLYVLVEKPGMRLSGRLRNKLRVREQQKAFAPPPQPVETQLQNEELLDPEKTEPRVSVVQQR